MARLIFAFQVGNLGDGDLVRSGKIWLAMLAATGSQLSILAHAGIILQIYVWNSPFGIFW